MKKWAQVICTVTKQTQILEADIKTTVSREPRLLKFLLPDTSLN